MSRKLSLKEVLAHQADVSAEPHAPSASPEETDKNRFVLFAPKIEQPVTIARTLRDLGLSLRKAHEALNRLADKEHVVVQLESADPKIVNEQLSALGVSCSQIEVPTPNIREIREKLGHSQSEFATRFCLELDTLRNWEQGRNQPDAPVRVLMKIIELHPDLVDAVLVKSR